MGVERDTNYPIADEAMPPVPGEDQGLEPLLKEALSRRPDLAALAGRIEAQRLSLDAAEHGNYPSLRASAGAGTNGAPLSSMNNNWNAGIGLSWPLYSGGARETQADQARANLASLQAQADYQRQQVRLTVEQARLGVVSAKGSVAAAAESTKAARTQLDLAEGRYAAGVGSIIELQDAQVAYSNARAQEVQEQYKLATARAQLLQALGRE
jgi:outer membrane protein